MENIYDLNRWFQQYGYHSELSFVAFYGNKGQDLFGNFYECHDSMTYNGITARNSEALYQGSKFTDPELKQKFNNLKGIQAFFLARKMTKYVRPDWNQIKRNIMKEILEIKFSDPVYAFALIVTADRYLVEHCPVKGRDNYWSDNKDGSGQNELGKILMEIRDFYIRSGRDLPPSEDYLKWIKTC
jgi:ribA/ribD-fused uncharacterized protein